MTKQLMVQGTGSDVGKSLIVAGLCRAYTRRGLKVRPFKPQNMSNNAAVTSDDGEIGRAQALQAIAAKTPLSVHMNPVLLKPETTTGSQVVVQGKRVASMSAREFFKTRDQFMPAILESYERLKAEADLVLIEGAGSPAEVNLRQADLANMGFAEKTDAPVLLVGDIHRGGVIASLVGTKTVLTDEDAQRIKAFLINNFHGDTSLFDEGVSVIEQHTGWKCAGVVPHYHNARRLPPEDALSLEKATKDDGEFIIAVPRLSRISNFDDLDPLRLEPNVSVVIVQAGEPLPAKASLVLIPGSKASIADLKHFRAQGWDIDLAAHIRRGGNVLGLCGGYQMLGKWLHDPDGIEGAAESVEGLGYLDVETTMSGEKALINQTAVHLATNLPLDGYEMHKGATAGKDCVRPFALLGEAQKPDGAISADGQIIGTYLHGIFASDDFRRAFLSTLGQTQGNSFSYSTVIEETLDGLADHLETHMNLDALLKIAGGSK